MNRILGNVIVIDSAMGNALLLTSASQVIHIDNIKISAISFLRSGTDSALVLTGADTATDIIFSSNIVVNGVTSANGVVFDNPHHVTFPGGITLSGLKAPVVTAGTAYLYLL